MELLERSLLAYTLRSTLGQACDEQMTIASGRDSRSDTISGSRPRDRGGKGPSLSMPAAMDRLRETSPESKGRVVFFKSQSSRDDAEIPPHMFRHVALQLVSALVLLHNHGLVHADIKPENVLLAVDDEETTGALGRRSTSPSFNLDDLMRGGVESGAGVPWRGCSTARLAVKLCDFGNAIHSSEAGLYYDDFEIQTLAYRAPEVSVIFSRGKFSGESKQSSPKPKVALPTRCRGS